jgi:hypothetical protein
MPEHRIRLRGAWDWHVPEGDSEVVRRVDLPTGWPAGLGSPFRLVRRFGSPRFDPATESARLELRDVPGLVAARLNGRDLPHPPAGSRDWSIPLAEPLPDRNVLVLEVELGTGSAVPGPWGSVSLVISPRLAPSG